MLRWGRLAWGVCKKETTKHTIASVHSSRCFGTGCCWCASIMAMRSLARQVSMALIGFPTSISLMDSEKTWVASGPVAVGLSQKADRHTHQA